MTGKPAPMMTVALLAAATICLAPAPSGAQTRLPDIGYVYPAGGQQGAELQISVGGQNLMGVNGAFITGAGVSASVIEYVRPLGNKQLGDIGKHLRVLMQQRWAEAHPERGGAAAGNRRAEELPELPDHPLLRGLQNMSLEELQELRRLLYDPKRQPNAQIAETVLLELTIAPDAAPGDRELRLSTPFGLTNPLCLQVGRLPEVQEPRAGGGEKSGDPPLALPVVINGRIMPGEVDRYHLAVRRGEKLVIAAHARSLIPYLADAVPGWFQAVLELRDPEGRQVAYVDDYHFDPDPVILHEAPRDGDYLLEIRDAIYRGREDFVYRITAGEQPFITGIFPLGGSAGTVTTATVSGWNLPWQQVKLDTSAGGSSIRPAVWSVDEWSTNSVRYAVDTLPQATEAEPNDAPDRAQQVSLPVVVNGRIATPDDVDLFEFQGHAGDELSLEVQARRLGSPLDSLIRLTDAAGAVVAWNDDFMEKDGDLHTGPGLITHHADSCLLATLPTDGLYRVRLSDARDQGSDLHAYRLRISPPQPDFAVCVTPSSVSMPAGRATALTVHVARSDGFTGPIAIALKGAPAGFELVGGVVQAGRRSIRVTLTAPEQGVEGPVALELEAVAQIAGAKVTRPVTPAEDMMQAFLWRHLVPSQTLTALVGQPRRFMPTIALAEPGVVRIPAGGSAQVPVTLTRRGRAEVPVQMHLIAPPDGLTLQTVTGGPDAMTLLLAADAGLAGYADNLIVEAVAEVQFPPQDDRPARKQRMSLGMLPAIAFEVVQP